MFYELIFDMGRIDESIKSAANTIYAEATNMDYIEYPNIKKGFFDNIILSEATIEDWPNVEFYYSSKVSNLESDYLLNIKRWPIVHKRVKEKLEVEVINGVKYSPIRLIDVVTQEVNNNYFLMYVSNFIDAYDMDRSQYKYNEQYNIYTFIPDKIYLDDKVCSKFDIFRCQKSVAPLYVSEKIKNIIEKNNWIGFDFYQQEN